MEDNNEIKIMAEETIESLRKLTSRDHLTGAYNRKYMERRLDELIESKSLFGLMLFDLDDLKKVNDSYGHGMGDKMLKHLVTLVTRLVEAEDAVCRYGGEEFVVIMPGVKDTDVLGERTKRIIKSFGESFVEATDGEHVSTTLSAGASIIDGSKVTRDEALSKVDGAMYTIKKSTKNSVAIV